MHESVSATRKALAVALLANLVLAALKLVAGAVTGAAALVAEAAHSFADACNQGFLLVGVRLGATRQVQPYGHGKDRFFWSFLGAVLVVVAAALVSIGLGVLGLLSPRPPRDGFLLAHAVLGVALLWEALAFGVSVRELRRAARAARRGFWEHLEATRNTALKVPFYEDAAAIVGVLLAAGGLLLSQLTGDLRWDAVASLGVGGVLLFVAWELGADTRGVLVGEAMEPEARRRLHQVLRSFPEVVRVERVLTMHVGPEDVLVNADVQVLGGLRPDQLEALLSQLNRRITHALPQVRETFIELHLGDARLRERAAREG